MLYIVGTPIGNLEDISMRAIRILGEVDFILCEDTRTSGVLLEHYNIKTPRISYHQHSDDIKVDQIIKLLEQGKNLALITDAGTPGISDPGGVLVSKVLEHFGEDIKIESVPGPSAVTAALSISGIPTDKFIFMGFPPHKKGRQTFIRRILESEYPVVVYESKHRIVKFLNELKAAKESASISDEEKMQVKKKNLESVVVAREISKMHETVYRGDIDNIIAQITATPDDQRGEFVVIVG
jgi:16S rRNA (cytidine1402-2'-O)-methyltransferase